ncbi:MAG: hypothetical protein ACHQK9_19670 [Reyranellales bacterium]
MKTFVAVLSAAALLGACTQPPDDGRQGANSAKYNRDRELCRAQVDEYMKTRRTVDDSRRDVFSDSPNRAGQTELPSQMDAYGDSRSSDRLMESCMGGRGWPQPQKSWWQKIGS